MCWSGNKILATTTSENVWLTFILCEFDFPLHERPNFCDNLGVSVFNPINHSRMKHIQTDLHFVRDLVQKVNIIVNHVKYQMVWSIPSTLNVEQQDNPNR